MDRRVAGVFVAVVLLASPLPAAHAATEQSAAVIGLIDTGINPYHVAFRDQSPRSQQHPSTYIPGFPKEAEALRLSLNEKSYRAALIKDCRLWNKVERGKLYWFPGTKIIGAITFDSFDEYAPFTCRSPSLPGNRIIDPAGHGTMVASRAAGNGYGACSSCRIVAIQGFENESIDWAAAQASWLDAQSNSWGAFLPLWDPSLGGFGLWNEPTFVRKIEAAAQKHLSLWASGNGTMTRFGLVGHPTPIDPRMTPSVVMVGGHDSGYVNLWPDFPPHVVSDSCNSWAAYHDEIDESADDVGSGTSGATPFVAGGAGEIVLAARKLLGDKGTGVEKGVVARGPAGRVKSGPLKDGRFTLQEWKEVLFKTATARPQRQEEDGSVCDAVAGLVLYSSTPVRWEQVPDGYPEYLHIGYGAVDRPAIDLAVRVLRGTADLPDRSETDSYFESERPVRQALHDVFDG